jgi:hypothetical protein
MTLHIAGREVTVPMDDWSAYAQFNNQALERYDYPGTGDPRVLTPDEVWRSRAIHSRVTHAERAELPDLWLSAGGADIPPDARIQDADPLHRHGLYDQVQAVVREFVARRGVGYTKAYKVLHVKRPHLFPVLDARLRRLYAGVERQYSRDNQLLLQDDYNYWGVIRGDVIRNETALRDCREQLEAGVDRLPRMVSLSDIRLLDIVSWRMAR